MNIYMGNCLDLFFFSITGTSTSVQDISRDGEDSSSLPNRATVQRRNI